MKPLFLASAGLIALAGLLACTTLRAEGEPEGQLPAAKLGTGPAVTWTRLKQETELGQVRWQRSFEEARDLAREAGRPLFVLFDEVPG